MYAWIVLLHVLSVVAFLMVHGVSAAVAFQLRREQQLERARGLLELAADIYQVLYPSLIVILLTGVILAFMGGWWGHGWVWVALVLFVVTTIAMQRVVQPDYMPLRKALGVRYFEKGRVQAPLAPAPDAEVIALLRRTRPGWWPGSAGWGWY